MTADEGRPKHRRSLGEIFSEWRFAPLLAILTVLFAVVPILFGFGVSAAWFDGLVSLLMLAAIWSMCFERRQRLFALLFGIPTILLSVGRYALSGAIGNGVAVAASLGAALFFFGAAILTVRTLLQSDSLKLDSIIGALCGYLLLGVGWAVLYAMIEDSRPGSFAISPSLVAAESLHRPLPHVLTYYSFVTLTTVGYGDVNPTSPTTCTLAWVEAVTGQFYLAVIVAGLVSALSLKHRRPD